MFYTHVDFIPADGGIKVGGTLEQNLHKSKTWHTFSLLLLSFSLFIHLHKVVSKTTRAGHLHRAELGPHAWIL